MPIEILMPALSPTMTEGNLATWSVAEGDSISAGDVICEIETDKATMEVEAVDEGVIGKIVVPGGTEAVAVNALIALLLEEGEDASALDGYTPSAGGAAPAAEQPAAAAADAAPTPAATAAATPAAPAARGARVFASPLARRIAADKGLDLGGVKGSGPHGRIVKRDVEALSSGAKPAAAAPAPAPAFTSNDPVFANMPACEAVPNSNMRKIIARRLTESARDVPHFNLTVDVEIDKLLAMRKDLNARENADYKISVNDFIVKATAYALTQVPDCNVAYTDDAILKFKQVDMAIAVAIEGGLITPIVKDAANKGLATLSKEIKELAGKARDGKLTPEEFQGGTFTISNLGMFGVKGFNSIINPPQGGILSVGAGEQRAVVKDGALAIATVVTLTLAVDHRCIDGATGAAFIKELKAVVENPVALML